MANLKLYQPGVVTVKDAYQLAKKQALAEQYGMGADKFKLLYETDFASMELKVMAQTPAYECIALGKTPHYVCDRDGTPKDGAGHQFSFFDGAVLVMLDIVASKSVGGHYGTPKDQLDIRVSATYPGYMSVSRRYTVKVPKETYESDLDKWRIAGVIVSLPANPKSSTYRIALVRGAAAAMYSDPVQATIEVKHGLLLEDAPNSIWLDSPLPLVKYERAVGHVVFKDGKKGPFAKHLGAGKSNFTAACHAAKEGETVELWSVTEFGEKHTLISKNSGKSEVSA